MANPLELSDSSPSSAHPRGCSRTLFFLFAVLLPVAALVTEVTTGMCKESFFDPIPSTMNVLMIALVPVGNFLAWRALSQERIVRPGLLLFLSGLTLGTAGYYALLFIPLSIFGAIVVLVGVGLLPWAPAAAFLGALVCTLSLKKKLGKLPVGALLAGLAVSLSVLVGTELKYVMTNYAMHRAQDGTKESIQFLRRVGDEEFVLKSCYMAPTSGLLLMGSAMNFTVPRVMVDDARLLYFRMTGVPFNSVPAPAEVKESLTRWGVSPEQGGELVGGKLKTLHMESSDLLCSVRPESHVAYLEWTMVFRNDHVSIDHEARTQLLLPPGAVISRATLWVNGKEKEAAFASRAKARESYEKIVRRSLDPLLVTTDGPDRALVQCFPVQPGGGKIRIRIGITAPLSRTAEDSAIMPLPRILERNFSLEHEHQLEVLGAEVQGSSFQLSENQAQLEPSSLADPSVFLKVKRKQNSGPISIKAKGDGYVVGRLERSENALSSDVVFVVDGSEYMKKYAPALSAALPGDARIIFSGDEIGEISTAEIENQTFVGGQDNAAALHQAVELLSDKGTVVWLHGTQPVRTPLAEGLRSRLSASPGVRLLDFSLEVGPNRVLEELDGVSQVECALRMGGLDSDLKRLLTPGYREHLRLTLESEPKGGVADDHLARLWAAQESERLWASGKVDKAVELAVNYQLVTPASGAVVLETKEQDEEAGLTPVDADTVPSIPEPEVWMLLFTGLLGLAIVRRRRFAC